MDWTWTNELFFSLEYAKGLRIFALRSKKVKVITTRYEHDTLGWWGVCVGGGGLLVLYNRLCLPNHKKIMGYYSLIILRSHHRRSDVLACVAPPSLSLWVWEELSHCFSMQGVELVDKDAIVGVLGRYGRPRLPVKVAHPLHHRFEAGTRESAWVAILLLRVGNFGCASASGWGNSGGDTLRRIFAVNHFNLLVAELPRPTNYFSGRLPGPWKRELHLSFGLWISRIMWTTQCFFSLSLATY
jgi:hypothetical protein